MVLSVEEIQQRRTPSELLAFVESVWERAKTDAELRTAGHLRNGYLKVFFDEVVPLSKFAAARYPSDYSVCPVIGNQGYDAEIYDERGHLFERVEIANPVDGYAIAKAGRDLAEDGIAGFRVGDPGDDLEDLISIIERTALNKSIKDYSDSTVVFNVSAIPAFEGFESRHEEQLERIRRALASTEFCAKCVYVMFPAGRLERIDA